MASSMSTILRAYSTTAASAAPMAVLGPWMSRYTATKPRQYNTAASAAHPLDLKSAVAAKIPVFSQEVKELREKYGENQLGTCSVNQAYQGMRSVKCMTYETSLLDSEEGIRFRGYSIPECQKLLPTAKGGKEPLPESLLWLLLTGDVPSNEQIDHLKADLARRSKLPDGVAQVLDSVSSDLHPMSQLGIGLLALQKDSVMAREYAAGTTKNKYWEHCFEDSLNLIARMPEVAARIYRKTYKGAKYIPSQASKYDLGANLAHMMGFNNSDFDELMRLYLTIHADHEGGNVSAHTVRLVGSALSDPYYAVAGGMCGLAGPLHGLANQEVLNWLIELRAKLGTKEMNKENLTALCWETLNSGQVIPGFGHAVLRKTDPRYMCQREFAQKHLPNDEMFKLVSILYDVVPQVLTEQGKVKNPWPNVDAHSGVLLQYYGLKEQNFYTVLFGVSRAIGTCASLIWDRALQLPLERPKSVTTKWIREHFAKHHT
eukprot:CAMPEP_0184694962 /NCGR_PEP_ID=MMETSP0313-20130426/2743_1 /TAXON_ID=2792 /ORGANISM="Porphyridium aerugineum, Strain SAG 1380-2" /LENGTH=486 /DNA_ID=CAMNT_0027153331 /DNA_START=119 /DNA_END=1579 /DNA_ORIENTATION=+